jgi:hypothetical protein
VPHFRDDEMRLDAAEADLLRGLAAEMQDLLRAEVLEDDPVMLRLFPDAYDSPEDADSFREMVGDELRKQKLDGLDQVRGSLGSKGAAVISLDAESSSAWLTTLADMRLSIGTRLGVTEETMAQEVSADAPEDSAMLVLHWLGWLQESMLEAMFR